MKYIYFQRIRLLKNKIAAELRIIQVLLLPLHYTNSLERELTAPRLLSRTFPSKLGNGIGQ